MYRKISITFIIIVLITVSILGCSRYTVKNDFSPKVLVIYKKGTNNYLDAFQNYKQSYILNAKTIATDDTTIRSINLNTYDVVYPDPTLLSSSNIDSIKQALISYVSNGGNLFLENEWASAFSSDFTGIISTNNTNNYNFTYPDVPYNLKQFQLVAKSFLDNFTEYRLNDLKSIKVNTLKLNKYASSIVNSGKNSIFSFNKYEKGFVLTASNLLPNKSLITGFDMIAKTSSQKYFDYSFATVNYYIRNEFLSFSMKEKYGFTLKKVFGPYGRPAIAWQNHYEGLSSIKDEEMVSWIDTLKNYNEIPSMSLIRSAFDWGKWQTSVTVHLNVGTNTNPSFIGEYENSYYSSGQRIVGSKDYITFGDYPKYASLNDPITLPDRAYPTVVDYNNDGKKDLIVGAPDGKVYLLINNGTQSAPAFVDKEPLLLMNNTQMSVSSYASPYAYDINHDGLFDLAVGDGSGYVNVFINKGTNGSPKFDSSFKLLSDTGIIKVAATATPSIGYLDDKTLCLVVGSSDGKLLLFKYENNIFKHWTSITDKNLNKYSAPAIYDWDNDGHGDILVGDNSGEVKLFINNNMKFTYNGTIKGQTNNLHGDKSLLGGHNSVPVITDWNSDGKVDLIVGQLEFSIPYDINSKFFKYKAQLTDIINYAQSNGVPIYPHFYTHKYKSAKQESAELALQKKAFEYYGLPWNSGTNQHTWQTNNSNPQQTLLSAMKSGLWWNFGFNPPNEPDLPRDGKEFMWSTPFLLSQNQNNLNFVTFTPSPNLFEYPNAYQSFSMLDMPITYFEHIEYRFSNPGKLDELKQMASFLNNLRNSSEYNFMTEEQMAKSFINTFFSNVNVKINNNQLQLNPDASNVPSLAGEYQNTLGLKIELGEKYKDAIASVNSDIYYTKDSNLYFAVNKLTNLNLNNIQKTEDFHIVRSNTPISIFNILGRRYIKFKSKGMQEIKIYSEKGLKITGNDIKIAHDKNFYTITHYGEPITIKIKE